MHADSSCSQRLRAVPSAAFTLVEILVAMGVTVLMLAFFISFTGNILNQWNRFSGQLSGENQATLVMDQLATDLGTAVIRPDGRVWLAATIQPDQLGFGDAHGISDSSSNISGITLTYSYWFPGTGGMMKPFGLTSPSSPNAPGSSLYIPSYQPPVTATQTLTTSTNASQPSNLPDLATYRFGQAGVWLRMFVPMADSNNGDPKNVSAAYRAVGYQIIRMRQSGASQSYRYNLFRSTVRPFAKDNSNNSQARSTFSAGYDFFQVFNTTTLSPTGTHTGVISLYNTPSSAGVSGGSGALGGGGGLAQDDAGNIRQPNRQQLIANNVIDFGVRFWGRTYDSGGKPMDVLLFPSSRNFTSTPNLGFAASTEDGFTRRDDQGRSVGAIQPSLTSGNSYTGWTWNTSYMTYAFAYNSNGTPGPVLAGTARPSVPVYADVLLRILDDEGARLIDQLEAGQSAGFAAQTTPSNLTAAQNWWRIAEAHSRVYTRRVQLLGVRPL